MHSDFVPVTMTVRRFTGKPLDSKTQKIQGGRELADWESWGPGPKPAAVETGIEA